MDKDEIFNIVKKNIISIFPEVEESTIMEKEELKEMGMNSVDRIDFVIRTMEDLNLELPMTEIIETNLIGKIVDFFYDKLKARPLNKI